MGVVQLGVVQMGVDPFVVVKGSPVVGEENYGNWKGVQVQMHRVRTNNYIGVTLHWRQPILNRIYK